MKIVQRPDLKQMSTLKMGGQALAAYFPQDYLGLEALGKIWPELGPDVLILGRGSNILFQDGIRGFSIIVWEKRDDPVVTDGIEGKVMVQVDSGMSLPGLLGWCAKHGLTGLEGLAGIPGRLGGAIAMNAGSYGAETGDALKSVTVWTPDSGILEISRDGFEAGYRKFRLKYMPEPFLILKACFCFEKSDSVTVRSKMNKYYSLKKKSQPILKNTCGCVFKNPDKLEPAGLLLEKAGFRGKTRGGVCFSAQHSNFLVNSGRGGSREALELISEARDAVLGIFGARLELEIKVV